MLGKRKPREKEHTNANATSFAVFSEQLESPRILKSLTRPLSGEGHRLDTMNQGILNVLNRINEVEKSYINTAVENKSPMLSHSERDVSEPPLHSLENRQKVINQCYEKMFQISMAVSNSPTTPFTHRRLMASESNALAFSARNAATTQDLKSSPLRHTNHRQERMLRKIRNGRVKQKVEKILSNEDNIYGIPKTYMDVTDVAKIKREVELKRMMPTKGDNDYKVTISIPMFSEILMSKKIDPNENGKDVTIHNLELLFDGIVQTVVSNPLREKTMEAYRMGRECLQDHNFDNPQVSSCLKRLVLPTQSCLMSYLPKEKCNKSKNEPQTDTVLGGEVLSNGVRQVQITLEEKVNQGLQSIIKNSHSSGNAFIPEASLFSDIEAWVSGEEREKKFIERDKTNQLILQMKRRGEEYPLKLMKQIWDERSLLFKKASHIAAKGTYPMESDRTKIFLNTRVLPSLISCFFLRAIYVERVRFTFLANKYRVHAKANHWKKIASRENQKKKIAIKRKNLLLLLSVSTFLRPVWVRRKRNEAASHLHHFFQTLTIWRIRLKAERYIKGVRLIQQWTRKMFENHRTIQDTLGKMWIGEEVKVIEEYHIGALMAANSTSGGNQNKLRREMLKSVYLCWKEVPEKWRGHYAYLRKARVNDNDRYTIVRVDWTLLPSAIRRESIRELRVLLYRQWRSRKLQAATLSSMKSQTSASKLWDLVLGGLWQLGARDNVVEEVGKEEDRKTVEKKYWAISREQMRAQVLNARQNYF